MGAGQGRTKVSGKDDVVDMLRNLVFASCACTSKVSKHNATVRNNLGIWIKVVLYSSKEYHEVLIVDQRFVFLRPKHTERTKNSTSSR